MRTRVLKAALTQNQGYVCLSCRAQSVALHRGRSRRSQHTDPSGDDGGKASPSRLVEESEKNDKTAAGSTSKIRDIIRDFMFNDASKDAKNEETHQVSTGSKVGLQQPVSSRSLEVYAKLTGVKKQSEKSEIAVDDAEAKQKVLQQKFSAQRRQQKLQRQGGDVREGFITKDSEATSKPSSTPIVTKPRSKKPARPKKLTKRALRRAKTRLEKIAAQAEPIIAKQAEEELGHVEQQLVSRLDPLKSMPDKVLLTAPSKSETASTDDNFINNEPEDGRPGGKSTTNTRKAASGKGLPTAKLPVKGNERNSISEEARKAELIRKLSPLIRKQTSGKSTDESEGPISRRVIDKKHEGLFKVRKSTAKLADVAGFESLKGAAIGKKAANMQANIERADATKLEILPIEVEQPPVPGLAYGLERVLFNPGVYQLQDPRSRVYNFDPYLQNIMPVAEFDFNALKEYITSSKDESLKRIAKEHQKRYVGSTSSMTGALAHFHFLLSQWRPINTSMMSKTFPTHLSSFTELQRTPSAIFLKWKDGSYAIDADKQFANANVLSMLGKSMEKLLTLDIDDYERYRKSNPSEVTYEEQAAPESFHYSTMGDFLMRSQLDAHDPRLPGTGMFDLKTRAVVSIRMDVSKYEHGLGYQIKSRQGEWESYEREYYDMIRAAFLKYSMQVRMGRMDGIFVAFHNIERIFGFQYISLPEMDSTIHGQWDTSIGDQEFKLSLDLLNKILNKATQKFPETSLRIHFETRDAATPFMYTFAEPVTEEQVTEIQGQNDAKIEEFERKILGLNHGDNSETQDNEDDGKWDHIQASVQEAMDKDEMSVNESNQNQEFPPESMDNDRFATGSQDVLDRGPLYASKNRDTSNDSDSIAIPGEKDDSVDGFEIHEKRDESQEHVVYNGKLRKTDEEVEVGKGDQETDQRDVHQQEPPVEAVEEDSAVSSDPADETQMSAEPTETVEGAESDPLKADLAIRAETDQQPLREPSEPLSTNEATNAPSSHQDTQQGEKVAYTPHVPGEKIGEAEYPTEADRPFLDSMDQEAAQPETNPSSEILAMTLILRNKVNNQFVLRPEKLTSDDVWSIEYNLLEVPTQKKAQALYEACQIRRKKKLDREDEEVVSHYLENLRKMSARGKEWRKKMDERDRESPIQVLGRDDGKGEGAT